MKNLKKDDQKMIEFPIDAFPKTISESINNWNRCNHYHTPEEYLGLSILMIASTLIGNKIKIRIDKYWIESPIIYGMFVGPNASGRNTAWYYASNQIKINEQIGYYSNIRKVLKKTSFKSSGKILLKHQSNWKKMFKKERLEMSLEAWNGGLKEIQSGKTIIREKIFLNILAVSKPKKIKKLISKDKRTSILERFLFAYPTSLKKREYEKPTHNLQANNDYVNILQYIYNLSYLPLILEMTAEAKMSWMDNYNLNAQLYNNQEDDSKKGIIANQDRHCVRFALLLRVLRYAEDCCSGKKVSPIIDIKIEVEDVENAKLLSAYFLHQSMRLFTIKK